MRIVYEQVIISMVDRDGRPADRKRWPSMVMLQRSSCPRAHCSFSSTFTQYDFAIFSAFVVAAVKIANHKTGSFGLALRYAFASFACSSSNIKFQSKLGTSRTMPGAVSYRMSWTRQPACAHFFFFFFSFSPFVQIESVPFRIIWYLLI